MLKAIKAFFDDRLSVDADDSAAERRLELQLATAALLIEVARSDSTERDVEKTEILTSLQRTFELDKTQLDALVNLAEAEAEEATDVFQFTKLVNDAYGREEKIELAENLWRVAYADGRLDRFEEHFIRKVAGLIHLPHTEFIKSKRRTRNQI
jgi:uncharacterized tellurite resistance protein B-like protein